MFKSIILVNYPGGGGWTSLSPAALTEYVAHQFKGYEWTPKGFLPKYWATDLHGGQFVYYKAKQGWAGVHLPPLNPVLIGGLILLVLLALAAVVMWLRRFLK